MKNTNYIKIWIFKYKLFIKLLFKGKLTIVSC